MMTNRDRHRTWVVVGQLRGESCQLAVLAETIEEAVLKARAHDIIHISSAYLSTDSHVPSNK